MGQTVMDGPAPPLSDRYRKLKAEGKARSPDGKQRGTNPIRDWFLTGRLMRSTKVIEKRDNQCTLGATDATINARLFFNNRRARQFGVSTKDRVVLLEEFHKQPPSVQARAKLVRI